MTGPLAAAIRRDLAAAVAERSARDAAELRVAQRQLRDATAVLAAAQQRHAAAAALAGAASRGWRRRGGSPPDLTAGPAQAARTAAAAAVEADAHLIEAAARLAGAEVDALTAWQQVKLHERAYRRTRRRIARRWGTRDTSAAGLPPLRASRPAPPRLLISPAVTLDAAQFAAAAGIPQAAALRLLHAGADGAQRTAAGWRIPLLAVPAARLAAAPSAPAPARPVQQALASLASWREADARLAAARAALAAAEQDYRAAWAARQPRPAALLPVPPRRRPRARTARTAAA